MVMLVILVLGATAMLASSLSNTGIRIERDKITAASLAQAKEALIGRALADETSPGSLPCPDIHTPGDSLEGTSSTPCSGNVLGRLPWKTLRLPDLRDGSGERLWYALSPNFGDNTSTKINSNSKGTLLVYRTDGLSTQTEAGYDAVAVIFSPGSALGTQTRNTGTEQNNAANYLDIANSRDNASASGPFIAGAKSETFNDQLLFITTRNLMPLVEKRVAAEVKRALTNYYTVNGYYPWADSVAQYTDYDSNAGLNRGWLPNSAATSGSYPTPNWTVGSPPPWFFDNEWYKLIYYSVAKNYTRNPFICSTCIDSTLRVDGVWGVRALFFMPGTFAGTRRPDYLSDYLEDPENYDNNDDSYVTPASQAGDRDRLYRLP